MEKIVRRLASNHIAQLLSYPPYLYFSLSVFSSQVAFNMLNIVLIFLVFYLTSSSFAVALLLFTTLIPQILISFFGGVIADYANKKVILVIGNFLRAMVLLLLFVSFKNLYVVYFVTLIVSVITQFYVPAEAPLIPSLAEKDKLVAANSIFGISLFGSILIGYVVAGPAINVLGRANVFLLLSFVFLLATIFAALIPQEKISRQMQKIDSQYIRRSLKSEFRESYNLLKKTKEISNAFFLLIFSQVVVFILATLIPGYAKSILQVPAESLSIILFAPAALGMVISAILIGSVFTKTSKNKLTSTGIFISGACLMLLPFTSRILSGNLIHLINLVLPSALELNVLNFVLLIAFFAGFANALIFVPSQAIIQEVVPENFRSKIYGMLFALIGLFSLIPIIIAGGVADVVGVGSVLFIIGVLIVLAGLIRQNAISYVYYAIKK